MTAPTTPTRRDEVEAPAHAGASSVLVVLSGGQDSTTCLYWAKQQFDLVYALTVNYGQRHVRELDAARVVAKRAGVALLDVVHVPNVLRSSSPLVNHFAPLEQYRNADHMARVIGDRVELTFVPMRNAFFLTLAANRAVALNCLDIVTGVCQEDNANYPDCTEDFIRAQQKTICMALGLRSSLGAGFTPGGAGDYGFRIHTPLMYMTKAESVRLAIRTPGAYSALAYSHTAYGDEYPPTGKDHATLLRAQGFEQAGLPDPLVLRAFAEGHMALPTSENYRRTGLRLGVAHLYNDMHMGYPSDWINQKFQSTVDGVLI